MEWTAVLDTQQDDPEWYVVGAEEEVVALGLTEDAARLIAAAPGLLAAVRTFLNIGKDGGPLEAQYAAAILQARAAVAKAETGGSDAAV